jgi:hypothetical protein
MKQKDETAPGGANSFFTLVFLKTILKTVVFVSLPTLSLVAVGMVVDSSLSSAPVAILAGAALGFVVAALLVRRQIKQLRGARP